MWALDSPRNLLLGLVAGLVFGFLLQRGGVTRYRTIMGQFLLTDFTVLRVMLTAVVVGSIGVYAMHGLWDVGLHIKASPLFGILIGGIIFGVGMAILGYCPGTGFAAIGEGSRHAIPGVIGMMFGAAVYAELHPWFSERVLEVWSFDKITFADITGLSIWVFVVALLVVAAVAFLLLQRAEPTASRTPSA